MLCGITLVDITQTKAAERMGQNARKLLRITFDAFQQPARVLDADLRVLNLNARRLERESGLPGMILLTMTDVTGAG